MSKHRLQILAVCAALAAPALTSTHDAQAQGAPRQEPRHDAASLAKARELFQQGNRLYDEGKFPQAEALYAKAWKIKQSYDLAGNYGNLLADMAKPRPAAALLAFAIREFPAGGKPAIREALIKRLGEVKRLIGTVRIAVNVPNAEILVDGRPADAEGDEIYVDPSAHVIEARAAGYMPASEQVTAFKGKTITVSLTLTPPKGAHKGVVIAGGVLAGVGIIAGAVLLGVSASKGSTITDLAAKVKPVGCPKDPANATGDCAELDGAINSKATLGTAGVVSLAAGGAIGVATLIYGLAGGGKAPSRTGVRVLPLVTGDGGGLMVGGTF
jgi:hypothetical protein